MEEESNIKKANPIDGLETGALETGTLSAKDRVASAYESDLSGKNGPRARFDALEELIARQLDEFSSRLSFTSGDGTQVFGSDGHFVIQSPASKKSFGVTSKESVSEQGIWDLSVENFETGSVSIRVGSIITDATDVTDTLTITNAAASFLVADGDKMFLKITDLATPACELIVDSTWTDYPSVYEVTGTGAGAAFTAYYYPLYYFDANPASGAFSVADGLYGHKVVSSPWFRLVFTMYQTGSDLALTVPVLIDSHAPLPA